MAPVSDVMGDGTKDDEISQEEIDDFLAASSDSDEEDQSDAGITVTCADSTTCLFDSVDGDPHSLQRPTANHGPATATKDAVSQEDIDAFLADDSDSDSEFTGVTNNRGNTNEKERSETGSPNSGRDAISQDDIDDFLADCTDTEDDVPNMDVVKPSGGQGAASAEMAVGQGARTDKLEATSAGTSAPAAAGSSVDPVEESLEEKMIRMQAEMDRMKKLLDEQQQEKLQTQEKSPATKKRVSFGQVETKRLREAETDLFSSPSESKTSKDSNQSTKNRQSKDPSPECSGMAAGHRKINAKGITKEDASKIVGPLTFYKKEEVRPADDSGSDWDDMDGEKPYLSKEGRDIKKMLSGDRRRVAHTPKYESGEIRKRKDTWMGKSSSASHQPPVRGESSQGAKAAKKEFEDSDYMKERYSGIRIINPLISNAVMKMRMEKRKMIKMSELSLTSKNYLNDCDWVTIGVLVSKSDTRKSSNGKNYLVWKLSDLEDCDRVVSLFLFGECYAKLWKENTGIVIGLLNPSFMAPSEKSSSKNEVCLTIDHPQKVMMMGKAKDLGRCQSRTKAGNFCTNVVNKRTGEYCSYHVQAAYRKTSSKRPALQAGFNAPVPRSFEQKLFNAGQEVFYGGQSFSSESFRRQKKSEKVTLSSMNKHKKPGTMSLVKLQPEDEEKLKDLVSTKKEAFQDMLQRPTVGAINFMKHLQGAEKIEKEKKQKDQPMASVTFTDFLKEAKQVMARNRKGAKLPQAAGSSSQASGVTPAPSTARPQLGRGFAPGTDIFLESPTKNKKSQDSIWGTGTEESRERSSLPGVASNLKSISRKQAAAKLKKNIEQQDPNRVKKRVSPEAQQRIKKRLLETTEEKENPSELTPPSKKPRILGGLDIDSEEVQKLLKEGSSHKGAVDDVITEAEEKYFKALECKESMEEKMSKITQVLCSVVSCKVCKYTAQKPADRCKQLGHDLLRTKALKQFFKCCDCGNRCIAFDKYPKRSCKKCGGSRYERTSMLAERKGVKLDSEKLLLRGEEQKFLNSLN